MKALMTNEKLNKLWEQRQQVHSVVSTDWLDGKGHDSDFMTIKFDGGQSQTWERKRSALQWVDVTSSPVKAQQIKD
jgi:hypothetical protein